MKTDLGRWIGFCVAAMCLAVYTSCGATGTGSSSGGGSTVADTKSLSSIPEIDLSSASNSERGSANIAVGKGILGDKKKEADFKSLFSRLGCEVNQHMEEVQRQADQANAMLCHMRKAQMKVGTDAFVYNVINVPKPPEAMKEKLDEMRKKDKEFNDFSDDKLDAPDEDFRPEGKTMVVRAGNFGGSELRVDGAVQLPNGSARRLLEATITVDDSAKTVTGVLINRFPHGGKEDGARIDLVGKNVTVADGKITESETAVIDIVGQISGLFGDARVEYSHDKTNVEDKIRFYHKGNFLDHRRGITNNFTTAARAVQNAKCGCGAGEFSGTVPAIPVSDLVQSVPSASKAGVLALIVANDGLPGLTQESKVCPGPNGLSLASGNTCDVNHTFNECYLIGVADISTNFGLKLKKRSYSVTTEGQCAVPAAGNKKWANLSNPQISTAFTREWDGTIPAGETGNEVDLMKLKPTDFQECAAYEERFRGRKGAGGEGCHEQEHRKAIENDFKDEGGTLASSGDSETFVGQKVDVQSEQSGSYTRTRCWDNVTCTGQPISAQLVTREECKALSGKGWGPDSSDCRAP